MLILIAILSIAFIGEMVLFALDRYLLSLAAFVGMIALGYFKLTELAPTSLSFLQDHYWWTLTLGYLGVGIVTAAVKWFLFTFEISSDVKAARALHAEIYTAPAPIVIPAVTKDGSQLKVLGDVNIAGVILDKVEERAEQIIQPTEAELKAHLRASFVKFVTDSRHSDSAWYKIMRRAYNDTPTLVSNDLVKEDAILNLFTPSARKYVDRITSWIFQWPVVIVATLLDNLLIKLGKRVATALDFAMHRMSKLVIGKAVQGL